MSTINQLVHYGPVESVLKRIYKNKKSAVCHLKGLETDTLENIPVDPSIQKRLIVKLGCKKVLKIAT